MRLSTVLLCLALGAGTASADRLPDWIPREKPRRVVVTSTSFVSFDDLRFIRGSERIDPKTVHVLDVFAEIMRNDDTLALITARAFAGDVRPTKRARVATQRAQAVVDYVVAQGVARERLLPVGATVVPAKKTHQLELEITERRAE